MTTQAHAALDVLLGVAILGGFGTTLYMSTLPLPYLVFSLVSFVFGAVWTTWGIVGLVKTEKEEVR